MQWQYSSYITRSINAISRWHLRVSRKIPVIVQWACGTEAFPVPSHPVVLVSRSSRLHTGLPINALCLYTHRIRFGMYLYDDDVYKRAYRDIIIVVVVVYTRVQQWLVTGVIGTYYYCLVEARTIYRTNTHARKRSTVRAES